MRDGGRWRHPSQRDEPPTAVSLQPRLPVMGSTRVCTCVFCLPLPSREGAAPPPGRHPSASVSPSHSLTPSDSTEYLLSGKIGQSLCHLVPGVNREGPQQRQDKAPAARPHPGCLRCPQRLVQETAGAINLIPICHEINI